MYVAFPGSFDPPTNGHLDIIDRCSKMFSRTDVVIADNRNKQHTFTPKERYDLLLPLLSSYTNVHLVIWDRLMVDFMKEHHINIIVRGVRGTTDYEYEFFLAQLNKGLGKGIETILLPTDEKFYLLRSSVIKEVVSFGGDVSDKVPKSVFIALQKKLRSGT